MESDIKIIYKCSSAHKSHRPTNTQTFEKVIWSNEMCRVVVSGKCL